MSETKPLPFALIVVDVQQGFDDSVHWGPRNNPDCETNIAVLIEAWREHRQPVLFVRHDSTEPDSPLRPGTPGNAFQPFLTGTPDLLVCKSVNSAFYGEPDLHAWLQQRGIRDIAVCGITTNHCCETTARMAANLGYNVYFVLDATHTHDRRALDGTTLKADHIATVTAANLQDEFAEVITTQEAVYLAIA